MSTNFRAPSRQTRSATGSLPCETNACSGFPGKGAEGTIGDLSSLLMKRIAEHVAECSACNDLLDSGF